MKTARLVLLLVAGAGVACRGDEVGPTVLAKGLYSFQAPAGFAIEPSNPPTSICVGKARGNGLAPIVTVAMADSPKRLNDFIADCMAAVQRSSASIRLVQRRAFTTAAGLDGVRLVTRETVAAGGLQKVWYFFDGGAGHKLGITAVCLASEAARDTPLFDASVRSFTLE